MLTGHGYRTGAGVGRGTTMVGPGTTMVGLGRRGRAGTARSGDLAQLARVGAAAGPAIPELHSLPAHRRPGPRRPDGEPCLGRAAGRVAREPRPGAVPAGGGGADGPQR